MDKSKTNISVLCFVSLALLIGVLFVFDDAYGISLNFNIQVSLDQDEYEVGDEPIIEVTDIKKNISRYILDYISVDVVTRVSPYTVPVTVSTVNLVETDVNSGIFTGNAKPISEQDFTHSSGAANKYLSVSYTPVFRGQIYSSAYASLVASPSDSSTKSTDESNYRTSGTFSCPIISNYNEYGTQTHTPSFEYFECTYKHGTYGYPVGSIKASYVVDSVGVPTGWCTGKLSEDYYNTILVSNSHQIHMFSSMKFSDPVESLTSVKSLLDRLESANVADTCPGYEPPPDPEIKICESGQVLVDGQCITPTPTCTLPEVLVDGQCITPTPTCTFPEVLVDGQCITPTPTCTFPEVLVDGQCEKPEPEPKKQKIDAIFHVKGDVEIKRASGTPNEKLSTYSTLYPGDSIVTGPNETVTITFLSGDKVRIGPNSEFKPQDVTKDKTLLQLLKGKLHSIFVKKCSNVGECNVRTPTAVAAVRGTEFVTTHTDGITIFDLKEGTLENN